MIRIALVGGLGQLGFATAKSLIENNGPALEITVIDHNDLQTAEYKQRAAYLLHFGVQLLTSIPDTLIDYHAVIDFTSPIGVEMGSLVERDDHMATVNYLDNILYRGAKKLFLVGDLSMIGIFPSVCRSFPNSDVCGIIVMDTVGGSFKSSSVISTAMKMHIEGRRICIEERDNQYINITPIEYAAYKIKCAIFENMRIDGTYSPIFNFRGTPIFIQGTNIRSDYFKKLMIAALCGVDSNISNEYTVFGTEPPPKINVTIPVIKERMMLGSWQPGLEGLLNMVGTFQGSFVNTAGINLMDEIHASLYQYAKKVIHFQGLSQQQV